MLDAARPLDGLARQYACGGAASTILWIDPAEELIGMLLTQLVPSSTCPARREM